MKLDIKERVKIYQFLLGNSLSKLDSINIAGYQLTLPKTSKLKNRTEYLISPPFKYKGYKRYSFKYKGYYYDFFKRHNFFSLINIENFKLNKKELPMDLVKDFCCTKYYTLIFLWIRSIIKFFNSNKYKVKVKEFRLDPWSAIYYPLFSDLEENDPDIIINLSWFPVKKKLNENVMNLSIFNFNN
jgi:hypothetical protein